MTLGFGAALTHLLHDTVAEDVPEPVSIPGLDDDAGTVAVGTPDAVRTPVPETVARRARRRPGNVYTRKAERRYAADLADGRVPSLRAVMRDLGLGQPKAREVQAHLARLATAKGQVANG